MKLDTKIILQIDSDSIDLKKKNMITDYMHRIVSSHEYGSSDWHSILILCLRLKNSIEINNSNGIDKYLNMLVDEIGNNQDIAELRTLIHK